MPAGQQIALEPALALMLAEHLHDPPVGREVVIPGLGLGHPGAIGDLERVLPAVRVVLVRAEEPEVSSRPCSASSRRAGTGPSSRVDFAVTAPGAGTSTA